MARAGVSNTQGSGGAPVRPRHTGPAPKPTDEQSQTLALFQGGKDMVIKAGAGCGKTSTLVMMANATKRTGRYFAFNKALVEDSKEKFPRNVECSTAHSLAFADISRLHQKEDISLWDRCRSPRIKPRELAGMLGITQERSYEKARGNFRTVLGVGAQAVIVREALRRFCQSADPAPVAAHFPWQRGFSKPANYAMRDELLPFVQLWWKSNIDVRGHLPFGYDSYLKLYELRKPAIDAEFLLIDEAQDLSPVMISIAEQQRRMDTQLVFVGDDFQQIYEFTGAVNAMSKIKDARVATLSQSFRFGQAIADVANTVLANIPDHNFTLKGWGDESSVGVIEKPNCILTRTNALAVEALVAEHKKVHIVGGGSDMKSWFWEAAKLQGDQRPEHPDLSCFETWTELTDYVRDGGDDLKLQVNLTNRFGAVAIAKALENMPDEEHAEVIYSTAHKSKGREWDQVQLASDFISAAKCECGHAEKAHPQGLDCRICDDCEEFSPKTDSASEMRLLYVAVTRARKRLDPGALKITKNGVWLDESKKAAKAVKGEL